MLLSALTVVWLSWKLGDAQTTPVHALKLQREGRSDNEVAIILIELSEASRHTGFQEERIQMAGETLEIYGRLGDELGCQVQKNSLTPQKKPNPARSLSSQRQAKDIGPADLISVSAVDISIQGQIREGNSPFRGSPRNRLLFQLAP